MTEINMYLYQILQNTTGEIFQDILTHFLNFKQR